jgi:hypothetical protein
MLIAGSFNCVPLPPRQIMPINAGLCTNPLSNALEQTFPLKTPAVGPYANARLNDGI